MTQYAHSVARTTTNETLEQQQAVPQKKGGFFEGISIAQATAGTLAAVTSMLLSSQIGVTGSVIGVAVGAFVSTLATQVYKMFLSRSAEKIRTLRSDGGDSDQERTSVMTATVADGAATARHQAAARDASRTPRLGADAHISDEALGKRAAHQRKTQVQRGVIVVAIVSALVAVALSAGVINLVTAGEGLGTKTAAPTAQTTTDTSAATSAEVSTAAESSTAGKQQASSTTAPANTGSSTTANTKSSATGTSSETASNTSSSTGAGTSSGTSASTSSATSAGTSSATNNASTSSATSSSTGTSNSAASTAANAA